MSFDRDSEHIVPAPPRSYRRQWRANRPASRRRHLGETLAGASIPLCVRNVRLVWLWRRWRGRG